MTEAVGQAPGKALLMGEHAVVYGHPAIAVPLRSVKATATVEFSRNGAIEIYAPEIGEHVTSVAEASPRLAPLAKLIETVSRFFGEERQGYRVVIESSIPIGRGMGSGAAAAVALVKAVCKALGRSLDADAIGEFANAAEVAYHGNPSGVDTAVVARDAPVYFVKGKPIRGIEVGPGRFVLVVADTGIESSTAQVVEGIALARRKDKARYDSYFWELGSMASVAREVIRTGAPEELGLCMNNAQKTLSLLGVSCPELDALISTALDKGAFGAKLSGAGRGGAMIAVVDPETDMERFDADLRAAGAERVLTTILSRAAHA